MEELRIREKNIINIKIKDLTSYIKKNDETIIRLSAQDVTDFIPKQIKKLELKTVEYTKELEVFRNRITNISNGSLNQELLDSVRANEDIINKKTNEKRNKKIEEKTIQKDKEKGNLQISYNVMRSYNPKEPNQWVLKKEFSNFERINNNIPEYMIRNLTEMPNNKGYIWKDLWCFGDLEKEHNQPIILFEKLRNDVMRIHELDSEYYKIFEKIGKNSKRVLISKDKRRILM